MHANQAEQAHMTRSRFRGLAVGLAAFSLALVFASHLAAQLRDSPIPFNQGQSVTPSFEGWFENPDGTKSMSFGYMNRNRQEVLRIPVGPENRFEPGNPDRGQPTVFQTRRQTGVFTVVVPADFGEQKLTWTLVSHGQTISIPGHLRPEWKIDTLKDISNGNTPPVIRFDAAGRPGQGPGGVSTTMTAKVGQPVALTALVTDDLVPERPSETQAANEHPELGVYWSHFRGTGDVKFENLMPSIDASGKTTTTATFSEPGEHILRIMAWEGTGDPLARGVMAVGFQCCWTNGYVRVNVTR